MANIAPLDPYRPEYFPSKPKGRLSSEAFIGSEVDRSIPIEARRLHKRVCIRVVEEKANEEMFKQVLRASDLPEGLSDTLLSECSDVGEMEQLYKLVLQIKKDKGEALLKRIMRFLRGHFLMEKAVPYTRDVEVEVPEENRLSKIKEFLGKVKHYPQLKLEMLFDHVDRLMVNVEDLENKMALFSTLERLHTQGILTSTVDNTLKLLDRDDLQNPKLVSEVLDQLQLYEDPPERMIEVAKPYLQQVSAKEKGPLIALMKGEENLRQLEIFREQLLSMGNQTSTLHVVEDFLALDERKRSDALLEVGTNPYLLTEMKLEKNDREYLKLLIKEYGILLWKEPQKNFRLFFNCLAKVPREGWDRVIQGAVILTKAIGPKEPGLVFSSLVKKSLTWSDADFDGMYLMIKHKLLSGVTDINKIPLFGMISLDRTQRETFFTTISPFLKHYTGDTRMLLIETLTYRYLDSTPAYLEKLLTLCHQKRNMMNSEQLCDYLDSLEDISESKLDEMIHYNNPI